MWFVKQIAETSSKETTAGFTKNKANVKKAGKTNVCKIFINSLRIQNPRGHLVVTDKYCLSLRRRSSSTERPLPVPITAQILGLLWVLWHTIQSQQALDLVTQMYVVDGTRGFMTPASNSKSGHWSVVAKANSGAPSTAPWNAIDTDAVDAVRSQRGTPPQLLAAGGAKGP